MPGSATEAGKWRPAKAERRSGSQFTLVPLRKVDRFTEVRTQIDALIASAGISPGDRLPGERDLAEQLGVSRVLVREVLRSLEAQGVLKIRHGAGTFVLRATESPVAGSLRELGQSHEEFLRSLIEVRAALEDKVVVLAAGRATAADVSNLRTILARHEHELQGDPEGGSVSIEFEAGLGEAARNPMLAALQRGVHQLWVETWSELGVAPGSRADLHTEHLAILDAVAARDAEAARALMRNHVDRYLAGDALAKAIKERGRLDRQRWPELART